MSNIHKKHLFITSTLEQNPSKHKSGYVDAELKRIIRIVEMEYPFNIEKFNKSFFGNTCILNSKNEVVHHTFDVYQALMVGISNDYKLIFD